jgi:hypothetical protein
VFAGGDFTSLGTLPQTFLGAMGDLTTPTQLSLVSAEAVAGKVRITWYAARGRDLVATVQRRTLNDDWSERGRIFADGTSEFHYEDTDVTAGVTYGYRIALLEDGRKAFLGETWVDVPSGSELALAGPRPNPALGDLTVSFSLSDASPARLEVLDLAGRITFSRELVGLGAGNHVLRLAGDRSLAPGVYLLRLTQGHSLRTARAVIMR